jgi:squalene-hopene/tetraprenyl-beta-curcumene cyclase
MQSSNGGWAAFDKDNDKLIITKIPFCDFGEALDPPSADVTGHVLEALGALGFDRSHPSVERAYRFLRAEQEPDGSWFGRWGVNYIYGTAAVLPALAVLGEDMTQAYVRKAADWIVAHQNADGGWGESCASYMDDSLRGRGPSTASQTAWALLALLAVASPDYATSVRSGVAYLAATQRSDGTWDEPYYTGTGFPGYGFGARINFRDETTRARIAQGTELQRGFMLNYNMYRHYFPLMALGRARSHWARNSA